MVGGDLQQGRRAVHRQPAMRVIMPNGARLTFAYLERDADAEVYQGASYTRVYIEEAGNFPSPSPIMKLMATLRSGTGVPVGMRLTGNPGGPGHQWLRARYIDPAAMGWKVLTDGSGLERIYIPSRVTDNAYLGADYVQRLRASGSPELSPSMAGRVTGASSSGAFFPEVRSMERHVIAPRALPVHWARFRSFDWGSRSTVCVSLVGRHRMEVCPELPERRHRQLPRVVRHEAEPSRTWGCA